MAYANGRSFFFFFFFLLLFHYFSTSGGILAALFVLRRSKHKVHPAPLSASLIVSCRAGSLFLLCSALSREVPIPLEDISKSFFSYFGT